MSRTPEYMLKNKIGPPQIPEINAHGGDLITKPKFRIFAFT